MKKRLPVFLAGGLVIVLALLGMTAFADEAADPAVSNMYATFWALVPPIVAIVLALITKEVYSSLFVGIVVASLFNSNFHIGNAFVSIFEDGFIASLTDGWNVGILIFLVVLGVIVALINKAGGSAAYGEWAKQRIKSKKGAIFSTFALGVVIFVDDYFNCLTVGSVMRPVTDKFNVSRAKLAYIIDATAAPVCMIAPISSWAAAVTGFVKEYDGLELFIKAIPYNFYSLMTIVMIITITAMKFDFGPMKLHEKNAQNGDLYTTAARPYADAQDNAVSTKGKVIDLVLPVIILIVSCISGMVYTGIANGATDIFTAFSDCDASLGLAIGSVAALLIILAYYIIRRVLSFQDLMSAIPNGFKAMVPSILILVFAWTLSNMTGLLGADVYVSNIFDSSSQGLSAMLPAIVFLVAVGLSFATGTSWGTFGILLPIVVKINSLSPELLIISISACLAGSVCGDHCSPISDTTIMSSTGAQCDHINHVSTQLPYALFIAAISFVGYIVCGFVQNAWIMLPLMIVVTVLSLWVIKTLTSRKAE